MSIINVFCFTQRRTLAWAGSPTCAKCPSRRVAERRTQRRNFVRGLSQLIAVKGSPKQIVKYNFFLSIEI
ncbi:MAG: hypothetical protein EAZ77_05420 [Nostocales cyanobacterium]|nr:MAG: hypothetical protein EAZ77_05420 [Nostocales cyanobacterium]